MRTNTELFCKLVNLLQLFYFLCVNVHPFRVDITNVNAAVSSAMRIIAYAINWGSRRSSRVFDKMNFSICLWWLNHFDFRIWINYSRQFCIQFFFLCFSVIGQFYFFSRYFCLSDDSIASIFFFTLWSSTKLFLWNATISVWRLEWLCSSNCGAVLGNGRSSIISKNIFIFICYVTICFLNTFS